MKRKDPDRNYFVNTEAEREARGQGATSAVAPLGPQARSNAAPRASQPAECRSGFGQGPKGAILVSGGAGFVGSFTVRLLASRGEDVVVVDDLSRGHRGALPRGVRLVKARIQETARLRRLLGERRFDAVLHFAADCYVGESMVQPWKYWRNNVGGTASLLEATVDAGVAGFVLSSSCTVYGEPGLATIPEDTPRRPVNPYGRTKAVCEEMLEDLAGSGVLRSFRLRYFNAAGGAADGSLGEDHDPETHLIPLALRAARDRRVLRLFGDDYPTPDGTCVRDYVHVEDLARAHVAAVQRLREGHEGGALNLGTGVGASVKDIVAAAEKVTGRAIRVRTAPRRAGDPPFLVAAPGRARTVLDWEPHYRSADSIVATAWEWMRAHPRGFAK